ncbi:MAG: hypothetical protein ACM3QW_00105 [Ignavibacteriales bacterium]
MNTQIKAAFNQIKADETLVNKTQIFLQNKLNESDLEMQQSISVLGRLTAKARKIAEVCSQLPLKDLAVACLLVLMLGGGAGAYTYYQTPSTYLSVDINPSVELGINAFEIVVSAQAFNNDGKVILNNLDITGRDVDDAVQVLMKSAVDKGYIADDGSTVVSLTSECDDKITAAQIEKSAKIGAKQAMRDETKKTRVVTARVPLQMHSEATAKGITAGKLHLIKQLQQEMPEATVDQYKDISVKEILDTINAAHNKAIVDLQNEQPQKVLKVQDGLGNKINIDKSGVKGTNSGLDLKYKVDVKPGSGKVDLDMQGYKVYVDEHGVKVNTPEGIDIDVSSE